MGQASASAASSTGINSPGGSVSKNSPGMITVAFVAVVILFWLWTRRHK